jgi:inner membrane protein
VDTLTHVLSGALLARAAAPRRLAPGMPGHGGRIAAGAAGAGFPDIDFVMRAVDTLWYLNVAHQGATHSLVLLPLWALIIAWAFSRYTGLGWQGYFVPAALGIAIHIAGDLITAYGTMVVFPFSDWRPALSLTYVLDPWFTLIIMAGLLASVRWPARARVACIAALVGLTVYVGAQAVQQQRALGLGEVHARDAGIVDARVRALPQPLSPGHWMVIVSQEEVHHVAWARLLPGRSIVENVPVPRLLASMSSHYHHDPEWRVYTRFGADPEDIALARAAWRQDGFGEFRDFARIPALHAVEADDGRTCAWFMDLRFLLPALPPSFVFGMCRAGADAPWRVERRRGAMWLD